MKIGIFYFSATGNTADLAKVMKSTLESKHNIVEIRKFEEGWFKNYNDFDFFIFGSPKHYEYIPLFFLNWIQDNLSECDKPTDAAIFINGAADLNSGFKKMINILKSKNINVKATKTIKMSNNYFLPPFDKSYKEPLISSCETGEEIARKFAIDINNGKMQLEKTNFLLENMCKDVSYFFGKKSNKVAKNFSTSIKCNKCGTCVRSCPENNIFIKDGKIVFGDKCITCARCLNICPMNAILYKGKEIKQYKLKMKEI
ncbi:hypothetical protein H8S10_05570 [Clostridium sp. NSJ-49]|uniref:EFR1 family ferrodoxin n=1 Tax=Clostridium TaxID=1485 RepID=UPI00164A0F89|nr:EFR1 family ferrodoxin [Clostridium sp. NSJ-49]MBC5624923.1 hypothetical protein [Clostridium sp. NSJ-49]